MPQRHRWNPKLDQIKMWRSIGFSYERVSEAMSISQQRVIQIDQRFRKTPPPSPAERLEVAKTLYEKLMTANLLILSAKIKNEPIPTILNPWERQNLSGIGPCRVVLDLMKQDEADRAQANFYVTKTLCPALLTADLPNYWVNLPCPNTD